MATRTFPVAGPAAAVSRPSSNKSCCLARRSVVNARLSVVASANTERNNDNIKLFDSVKSAPMRLGAALSAAAATLGAAAASHASEIDVLEQELSSSFSVDLGGYAVDHKTLIAGVIFGQWVALVGAAVGGLTARQRGIEMAEVNAKIMEVNNNMRKQRNRSEHAVRVLESMAEDEEPEPVQLLKTGKSLLKESKAGEAKQIFEKSLQAMQSGRVVLHEPWKVERKARRGIGAACVQLKKFEEAEENYMQVVHLCESNIPAGTDRPELADAYGALADMYTDWGKLEKAAETYDKMILELV